MGWPGDSGHLGMGDGCGVCPLVPLSGHRALSRQGDPHTTQHTGTSSWCWWVSPVSDREVPSVIPESSECQRDPDWCWRPGLVMETHPHLHQT